MSNDRTLVLSTVTATIRAPIEKVDIADWLFNLPDAVKDVVSRGIDRFASGPRGNETGKDAVYAADGTLAVRCFAVFRRYIRERGSKSRSGIRRT